MPAKPARDAVEILYGDDGCLIMARGKDPADFIDAAHNEAAGDDYVITDPDAVQVMWIRAVPCQPGGHEFDDAAGYCEGGLRCHYINGRPGAGAFRGAFIDLTSIGDLDAGDPRMARYETERASMGANSNA